MYLNVKYCVYTTVVFVDLVMTMIIVHNVNNSYLSVSEQYEPCNMSPARAHIAHSLTDNYFVGS